MCTLTFAPNETGYLAGMNRDELRNRPAAAPPQIHPFGLGGAIYPTEAGGGTWIACNSGGNLLALLNWRCVDPALLAEKKISRGVVIPQLISAPGSQTTALRFGELQLDGCFPLRLVGVFPGEKTLREWNWDGIRKGELAFPWSRRNWFSSSLSDVQAQKERGSVCDAAWCDKFAGSEAWLRRLHRSHLPERGPFSICVHRRDASTVSYTEVECGAAAISMRYLAGSPCKKAEFDSQVHLARQTTLATASSAAL